MKTAEKFWDKVARRYAKSPIKDMDAYNRTMERTRFYLSREDEVLEVGCGTGSTALLLAERVRHITASDISSEMIRIAEDKAKAQGVENVDFIRAGIFEEALEHIPRNPDSNSQPGHAQGMNPGAIPCRESDPAFVESAQDNGPFDAVLAFNLLHLVEDTPAAIRRIRRLLKPEGLFISKTVCLSEHSRLLRYIIPVMQALGFAPHVSYMTADELASMIRAEGFEIIETGSYPARPPRPFIVAKKV